MKNRYNLALIPTSKSDSFIELAHGFSEIAYQYLLGENSLPHITLRHFEAHEFEIASIWQETLPIMEKKPITLELSSFSFTTSDNHIYWISLLPNRTNLLYRLHSEINRILRTQPKKPFDPHLTLLNTTKNNYQKDINKMALSFKPITDSFKLTLGRSDVIGQYREALYHHVFTSQDH